MVKSYSFHESNPNLGWLNHVKSIFLMVKSQFWAFREGPGEFDRSRLSLPSWVFPAGDADLQSKQRRHNHGDLMGTMVLLV